MSDLMGFCKDLAAGGLTGVITKSFAAPIERVKLLLQTQHGNLSINECNRYKGPIDCIHRVVREQGIMSLWRGNIANVIRYFPSQAISFAMKDKYKKILLKVYNNSKIGHAEYLIISLISGGTAGATALAVTHPMDVIRTRLSADVGYSQATRQFTGILHCMTTIFHKSGITGLYKGFAVSLTGAVLFRGLHMGGYDAIKRFFMIDNKSSVFVKLLAAQSWTILCGTICYPLDTIKRRVMMQADVTSAAATKQAFLSSTANFIATDSKNMNTSTSGATTTTTATITTTTTTTVYKGSIDCFRRIIIEEGWQALFRGLSVNVFRGASGAFLLLGYDEMKVLFGRESY